MGYEMWLNYDNDAKTFRIPVLPEKIKIKETGKDVTFNIDQIGEIFHKSKRGALRLSFSSYFPTQYGGYCDVPKKDFKSPSKCHKWLKQLMDAKNPAHFVLVGGPLAINCYVLISDYTAEEVGGDPGTIQYSLELKEYRNTSLRKIRNSRAEGGKPVVQSDEKDRVSNKEKASTYTIKETDYLWTIAKRFYGKGELYTKILSANRAVLDEAARKHGFSSCRNGDLIFAGTVITIPA